ncbi:MAG: MFS transporter [Treponema sp.]|nr:MFS transporter [Treponema sp.]
MADTQTAETARNPFQANPSGKKMTSVIAVYVVVVASIFVSSGASLVLPVAAREIGGGDIYSLAMTLSGAVGVALMPLYGYLGARNPAIRRPLFTVSLLVAAAVIFLRGIAPSMWVIVLPSVFLGMYGPSTYVLGYSTIRDMYDAKAAGTFLGVVGTMQGIGLLLGPAVSGLVVQNLGWRALNFIIFPVFALAALLMFFGCKVTKEETKHMATAGVFDSLGAVSVTMFLAALILFLSLGSRAPYGSLPSNVLLAIALLGMVLLIVDIRKKGTAAFVPAPVLKDRNTLCLTIANFFGTFSAMACTFFLAPFIMTVMGQNAVSTSIVNSALAIAGLFMGPIIGRAIGKAGNARSIIMWGSGAYRLVLQIALFIALGPQTPIWIIYIIMFLAGFYSVAGGVAPAVGPQIQLRPEIRQQGNSIIQLGQNFGASVSIAVYTAVIASSGGIERGFKTSLIIAAGAAALIFFAGIPLKKLEETQ